MKKIFGLVLSLCSLSALPLNPPLYVESYRVEKESLEKANLDEEIKKIQISEQSDEMKQKSIEFLHMSYRNSFFPKRLVIIKEIAERKSASAVVHFRTNDRDDEMIYINPSADITNEVIERLNNDYLKLSRCCECK